MAQTSNFFICRTCLKTNLTKENSYKVHNESRSGLTVIKDMLEMLIPEMDLKLSSEEVVICLQCLEALHAAHKFKTRCLTIEKIIHNHFKNHNISDMKVDLEAVIYNNSTNFEVKMAPASNFFACRTCLKTNLTSKNSYKADKESKSDLTVIKDMLEMLIPEVDLKLLSGGVVLCLECYEALHAACNFKNQCLANEKNYLKEHKKIDAAVDLDAAICSNSTDSEFFQQDNLSDAENCVISSDSNNDCKETDSLEEIISEAEDTHNTSKYLKRSYSCDQCEYKAYRLNLLKSHKLKHDRNLVTGKEYHCHVCSYTTLRKRALDRHLFTHNRDSNFACNICERSFAESYQLKLHLRKHSGQESPFQCADCGKGFLLKSGLQAHSIAIHQICVYCPINSHNCKHMKLQKCDLCENSYGDKRSLEAHRLMHTGGQFPYQCHHCDFGTAWKKNLEKHVRKHMKQH